MKPLAFIVVLVGASTVNAASLKGIHRTTESSVAPSFRSLAKSSAFAVPCLLPSVRSGSRQGIGAWRRFLSIPPSRTSKYSAVAYKPNIRSKSFGLMATSDSSPVENSENELYGIPGSGWRSPTWNWGSAMGTGHDCALICRRRWAIPDDRSALVEWLIQGDSSDPAPSVGGKNSPETDISFEEIKLILGLAWQRGRWDGSDGGQGGYSEMLALLADAQRYETKDEVQSARNFIQDVHHRFSKISRSKKEMEEMECIVEGAQEGQETLAVLVARKKSAGLVLRAMGFIESGL